MLRRVQTTALLTLSMDISDYVYIPTQLSYSLQMTDSLRMHW
jgi:hypothetical protein